MRIRLKTSFVNRLEHQIEFIALHNPKEARKFKKDILIEIKNILPNSYKHRKSIYFEDDNVRDLIFKGYTIVFRITDKAIEVFGFVKYQEKPL